ncbi:hypothetical protein AgCh_039100 [Apium graveolens]
MPGTSTVNDPYDFILLALHRMRINEVKYSEIYRHNKKWSEMAYLIDIGCGEGLSSSRPPLFDGTNFATWKTRFRICARSQGVRVWMAIEDGVVIPTKMVDDIIIEKKVSEYNAIEEERMNIDA